MWNPWGRSPIPEGRGKDYREEKTCARLETGRSATYILSRILKGLLFNTPLKNYDGYNHSHLTMVETEAQRNQAKLTVDFWLEGRRGWPVSSRIFGDISGPVAVFSAPLTLIVTTKKCLQTLPNVPVTRLVVWDRFWSYRKAWIKTTGLAITWGYTAGNGGARIPISSPHAGDKPFHCYTICFLYKVILMILGNIHDIRLSEKKSDKIEWCHHETSHKKETL